MNTKNPCGRRPQGFFHSTTSSTTVTPSCSSSASRNTLELAGARPQRLLWASTSVKDPAYPDTRYVTDLVAPNVVNTMPEATLRAVADHGQVLADSVRAHYDDAQRVLDTLRAAGVDYDDVVQTLEDDGVTKFDASWEQLALRLADQLHACCAAREGS